LHFHNAVFRRKASACCAKIFQKKDLAKSGSCIKKNLEKAMQNEKQRVTVTNHIKWLVSSSIPSKEVLFFQVDVARSLYNHSR